MPSVTVKDTIHGRLKRLAIDLGTTIGHIVHDACEDAITAGEQRVAEMKKSTKAGRQKASPKVN